MDKVSLGEQLNKLLVAMPGITKPVAKTEECPSAEAIVFMHCYTAFYIIVNSSEHLEQIYTKAEKEITELQALKGNELPRDLELVLLVAGDKPPDPTIAQRIVDDRYVSRKYVLYPDSRPLKEVLSDLPFWPPDELLGGTPISVSMGVQEVLEGYDPHLLTDLIRYSPGAEQVFENIRVGKYTLALQPSGAAIVRPSRLAPTTLRKLEALDITDFRGIRRLKPEDMPLSGDVIFIYGPNGVGKTSIADAVEWAITGQVDRLNQLPSESVKHCPDPIINVFSDKNQAQVTCHLSNCDSVSRNKHGRSQDRLIGSHSAKNDRALIDHVVGTKAPSKKSRLQMARLRNLFRSSHMLSQHDIRQFLERTKPTERFDILTNMIGAEEFVQFRKKLSTVLRHLQSHVGTTLESNKSLRCELDEVSSKLHERQRDLEKLSHSLTNGKAPEDLVLELLQEIRNKKCPIDETAVEKANAEPVEHRFELIAINAEAAVHRKKTETNDLLVRLKSLEEEIKGYIESRKHCETLMAEIRSVKKVVINTHADLQKHEKRQQDINTQLKILREGHTTATKRYSELIWLKENISNYLEKLRAIEQTEESLRNQRKELKHSEVVLEELHKSLSTKKIQLQEIELTISKNKNREETIVALIKQLPNIQTKQQDAKQLGQKEQQIRHQLVELQKKADSLRDEAKNTQSYLDELQRTYSTEAARHDILSSFLAKLAELVRSAECPLCGKHFPSINDAKTSISEHLSAIPSELKQLARRLDEAKNNAETKQAQADSEISDIHSLKTELEQICSIRATAVKEVQDYYNDITALDITISLENFTTWDDELKEAIKECQISQLISEASNLRHSTNESHNRVMEQQKKVDELRRKLAKSEENKAILANIVQSIKVDIIQRGFDPDSLPESNRLDADVSKAHDELKKINRSLSQSEAESGTNESAITELRANLKKANEDVASMENQLHQYETTCNRFEATCRATGVDPDNPTESIPVVKQKTFDLVTSLNSLEKKCQSLQQIVLLSRLKGEIQKLARVEGDLKQQLEKKSIEESTLNNWVSHVKGLERAVVKQQIDVVSAHLKRLEPTTQQLYSRLNPHPIFGRINIRVDENTHELDVEANASIARERLGNTRYSPMAFFSEAQMNSLAITVFLAGALRQQWSGFNTILIDDPIQQMDEINVYAFLDLVRGLSVSGSKQFIIFTCNRDFYLLALEKLTCLNSTKQGSFQAYRLEGISMDKLKVHCDAH